MEGLNVIGPGSVDRINRLDRDMRARRVATVLIRVAVQFGEPSSHFSWSRPQATVPSLQQNVFSHALDVTRCAKISASVRSSTPLE